MSPKYPGQEKKVREDSLLSGPNFHKSGVDYDPNQNLRKGLHLFRRSGGKHKYELPNSPVTRYPEELIRTRRGIPRGGPMENDRQRVLRPPKQPYAGVCCTKLVATGSVDSKDHPARAAFSPSNAFWKVDSLNRSGQA